jgi:hypothetical protein
MNKQIYSNLILNNTYLILMQEKNKLLVYAMLLIKRKEIETC